MTGNQLKEEIRKRGITQDVAASQLGVTRRTLQNWFALERLDANISQNVKTILGIGVGVEFQREEIESIHFVPMLPMAAQAGSLNDFTVSVKAEDCERIVSPIRNVDFAMPVTGESMAPEYPNGSQILIKKIDEKAFIEWGKVYVLDTRNGSIVKEVRQIKDDESSVMCHSLNPDPKYAPFAVQLADVFGMYRVVMCMSLK